MNLVLHISEGYLGLIQKPWKYNTGNKCCQTDFAKLVRGVPFCFALLYTNLTLFPTTFVT